VRAFMITVLSLLFFVQLAQSQSTAVEGRATGIEVTPATPIFSCSPVIIPAPGRAVELQTKITAPRTGKDLPIIISGKQNTGE